MVVVHLGKPHAHAHAFANIFSYTLQDFTAYTSLKTQAHDKCVSLDCRLSPYWCDQSFVMLMFSFLCVLFCFLDDQKAKVSFFLITLSTP